MPKLGAISKKRLSTVHPLLQTLIMSAIIDTPVDFTVTDGKRSIEDQKKYVASGASKTMNSKHLTGLAVDVAPYIAGKLVYDNEELWEKLINHIKERGKEMKLDLVFGYDWGWDKPHIEIKL